MYRAVGARKSENLADSDLLYSVERERYFANVDRELENASNNAGSDNILVLPDRHRQWVDATFVAMNLLIAKSDSVTDVTGCILVMDEHAGQSVSIRDAKISKRALRSLLVNKYTLTQLQPNGLMTNLGLKALKGCLFRDEDIFDEEVCATAKVEFLRLREREKLKKKNNLTKPWYF